MILIVVFWSALVVLSCSTCCLSDALKLSEHNNSLYVQDIMRRAKTAEMRNYMNESVDPCDNFYNFACGNWAKINPANSIEHLTTGFFEVTSKALERKFALLLKVGIESSDNENDRKVKRFFESCVKIKSLRGVYKAKLKQIIGEFGEMPVLAGESWKEDRFDWLETIAKISKKYDIDILLAIDILPDFANNTINRLYIGHPEFPLESKSMYLDSVTYIYRYSYKSKIAEELRRFLGLNEETAKDTAREIVDLEIELAKGMLDDNLGLDLGDMSELISVDAMHAKYSATINIRKLLNISLGELPTEKVYEFVSQYQENLVKVINTNSKRVVANYIYFNLIKEFFLKIASDDAKQEKLCIEKTKNYFAKNLDNMIYRKYNTKKTERDVNIIWQALKAMLKETLLSSRLNWIQLATRQYAVEKLNETKLEINSYENYNFTEELHEIYVNNYDYLENIKNILEVSSKQSKAELHQPPKPVEAGELLSYTPANIIIENKIKVPVSLLQPYYLWAASYPNALMFGTLGALVGHELIHGFDDTGRKYDKNGNSFDWWDEESTNAFVDRTKCFAEQYSQYVYGGRPLPLSASQSENIADNGGVRLAYAAYLRWYEEAVRSGWDMQLETLPTINYTSKQLFFISYAQVWCSDAHPRVRALQTSTDQHVPGMFRVIGPLSNFPAFSNEFNCVKGKRMNPIKKCEIY